MPSAIAIAIRIASDAAFLREHGRGETADALTKFIAGDRPEDAFHLYGGWREIVQRREQDRALRIILAALPPETSCRSAATAVANLLRVFQRTNRPSDRTGVRAALADYLAAHGSMSIEWLRKCDVVRAWVSRTTANTHGNR